MEKKITVITESGIRIRVAEHMVDDLIKFGCTITSPVKREIPKEILNLKTFIKPKESNLPPMEPAKEVVFEEPKTRKTPVRSKSNK